MRKYAEQKLVDMEGEFVVTSDRVRQLEADIAATKAVEALAVAHVPRPRMK